MDAQAIRSKFNDLPNGDLKEKMTKKVIVYDMDAKYFIEEIFNFIDVQLTPLHQRCRAEWWLVKYN